MSVSNYDAKKAFWVSRCAEIHGTHIPREAIVEFDLDKLFEFKPVGGKWGDFYEVVRGLHGTPQTVS